MSTFSTKRLVVFAFALAFAASTALGCSSVGPRKYLLFGPPQPQEAETFEDYWTDEVGLFKPDDPNLPLRRGKGAVIRFFKKGCYTKSVLVDGTLAVNVYEGTSEGISLTQPDMRLELTSDQLNDEHHRKFDKKAGYSYQVWLDFGEYDQPEKKVTVLTSFTDAKTGQTTLSKEIQIDVIGTSPALEPEQKERLSDAEEWARKKLNVDSSDPIGDLQLKYSARNAKRRAEEEATGRTRVRESIDLTETGIRALADSKNEERGQTLIQQAQERRDAQLAEFLEERREKRDYYRDKRRRETENYLESEPNRFRDSEFAEIRAGRDATQSLDFGAARPDYRDLTADFGSTANERAGDLSRRAVEEYAKGPESTTRGKDDKLVGLAGYDRLGESRDSALRSVGALERRSVYADKTRTVETAGAAGTEINAETNAESTRPATRVALADRADYSTTNRSTRLNRLNNSDFAPRDTDVPQNAGTAYFDGLDDFVPAADAPPTQVYAR